eukprot:TRINITY_DN94_c0_g1_i1.p1 TRINITY_DN94_c0_g1~~TRINITY_DN94_c0_g1_i1.p1  ORF type:complete len:977 (-),score=302.61 TRINITY_DN94_c0_g1_i1:442-3297(-)
MATGQVVMQTVRLLQDVLEKGSKIFTSLSEALAAASAEGTTGKCWLVLESGADALKEVNEALKDGQKRLCVVVAAGKGPVSQIEVLRAMEYGDVYAAAAEVPATGKASSSATERLKEAASFMDGPSFVLLAESAAVKGDDKWTTFRYDPRLTPAFSADVAQVRSEIRCFLDRENLLTLLAQKALPKEGGDDAGAEEEAGVDAKTVTILYTSDTGHGEECAKAVARQCKGGGFPASAVKCVPMNNLDPSALASEALVVFVAATAGKGEFPGNGRQFWNKISEREAELKGTLSGMKYAVFGLGDSHYWGKDTQDSKINFAKPARDLDELLERIGASRFMPIGFGDDQDADQYHTGFGEWKNQLYSRLGVDKATGGGEGDDGPLPSDEVIKVHSVQLRGTMKESFDDKTTGQLPYQDTKLVKTMGSYQQDDRDLREERQKLGIENAFSFMIRVRLPAGYLMAEQWIAMDDICEKYANGTMKITTRQTFQLHGVLKRDMKETMRAMNRAMMDTIAACGDVCRNVICTSDPAACSKALMDEIVGHTYAIHDHCLPRTGAYHEIFIMQGDEMAEKTHVLGSTPVEEEPLYGLTYLPRKYKIAVAIPPSNDVDVFAHDLGYIAIIENGKLLGYNISVGGGLGFTHNNEKSHPRLGDVIGFCHPKDCCLVAEAVLAVQRDFGDRTNRKHARVKYTVEDYGKEWFLEQVNKYLGFELEPAKAFKFGRRGDFIGWHQTEDGLHHVGLLIPIGRVKGQTRTGLKKIAELLVGGGVFRMTCNQQLVLSDIPAAKKDKVAKLLNEYKIPHNREALGGMRRNMLACVAMPTCPLAFAEAERYLPTLVERLEAVTERVGLRDDDITIRMTGCPNSCGRPSMAEIGFIGKAPGTYNMYLGGDFIGHRLNTLFAESVTEEQIIQHLTPMLSQYASERKKGESFGDFVIRIGKVKPMINGRDWWSLPQL